MNTMFQLVFSLFHCLFLGVRTDFIRLHDSFYRIATVMASMEMNMIGILCSAMLAFLLPLFKH